jgi:hypothetical protein
MTMAERSHAKLGYRESFGSKIVVYGQCVSCKTKCDMPSNGTIRCSDFSR